MQGRIRERHGRIQEAYLSQADCKAEACEGAVSYERHEENRSRSPTCRLIDRIYRYLRDFSVFFIVFSRTAACCRRAYRACFLLPPMRFRKFLLKSVTYRRFQALVNRDIHKICGYLFVLWKEWILCRNCSLRYLSSIVLRPLAAGRRLAARRFRVRASLVETLLCLSAKRAKRHARH